MWIPVKCNAKMMVLWLWLWLSVVMPVYALNLDFGRMAADEVAVYVQDLDSGQVLAEHRADVSMNPASTMKLVTTFAALRALGPDYRWRTEWKSNAPVQGGVLQGDVYWLGSGDPVFDQPDIEAMQLQLRQQGIERIGGRVVLDRGVWGGMGSADGFEADEGALFVTPPDPHMVAYKVLWATAGISEDGQAQFDLNPPLVTIPRDIQVTTVQAPSRCGRLSQYVGAQYQDGVLQLSGRLPISCVGEKLMVNMLDAPTFAQESFRGHWVGSGGNDVGFAMGSTPAQARVLAVSESKPLTEVLTDMNKFSNNLIARSVFLTIGAHDAASRRTVQNAKSAVRRQLVQAGLDDEALVMENGSGLSRKERLTARFMGQMLASAWHGPNREAFVATLPIAGQDGTLKNRFKRVGSGLRMKTGTLKNVRALAGYWLPEHHGEHALAVVVLVNAQRSSSYLPDMDKLVRRLIDEAQTLEKASSGPM